MNYYLALRYFLPIKINGYYVDNERDAKKGIEAAPANINANDLTSYGIAAGATPQKSEIKVKWDYTDFKWTLTNSASITSGTLYYDADGNKLK